MNFDGRLSVTCVRRWLELEAYPWSNDVKTEGGGDSRIISGQWVIPLPMKYLDPNRTAAPTTNEMMRSLNLNAINNASGNPVNPVKNEKISMLN